MGFRIGLAQSGYPADGDVLAQVRSFATSAAEQGVDLLVFPECLMSPRELSAGELRELAEPLDGPFVQGVATAARDHGLWVAFTMSEACPEGAPYNAAVVVDDGGNLRGVYRKCHLYDAHGVRESDRMTAGAALAAPVKTPFCTLGLEICYDLRFPEGARAAALAGCDMLVYPSAWYDGPNKVSHWETLLRARAIENELFVAGVCHAGERYVGRSLVADPLGRVLAQGPDGSEEALVVCDIDLSAVAAARDAMPVLDHRRPELY